ncbi:MAG: hypothetical protein ACR2LJ_12835 [Acidimicrobiales bacterium]
MSPPDSPRGPSDARTAADIDLGGLVLGDARTGETFDLGAAIPLVVLAVIRHRH